MNQTDMVIDFILENGSITTLQAFEYFGITRLSGRIWDIRHNKDEKKRREVFSEKVTGTNRYGKKVTFNRYWF